MPKKLMSRVRVCREQKSLTQHELAHVVGVSRQTIVAIERGNYVPSVGLAMELATYFRQPVDHLFYWN